VCANKGAADEFQVNKICNDLEENVCKFDMARLLWANARQYLKLVKRNHEVQKKKWNKDVQRAAEASADHLWPAVEKVLAESGAGR